MAVPEVKQLKGWGKELFSISGPSVKPHMPSLGSDCPLLLPRWLGKLLKELDLQLVLISVKLLGIGTGVLFCVCTASSTKGAWPDESSVVLLQYK